MPVHMQSAGVGRQLPQQRYPHRPALMEPLALSGPTSAVGGERQSDRERPNGEKPDVCKLPFDDATVAQRHPCLPWSADVHRRHYQLDPRARARGSERFSGIEPADARRSVSHASIGETHAHRHATPTAVPLRSRPGRAHAYARARPRQPDRAAAHTRPASSAPLPCDRGRIRITHRRMRLPGLTGPGTSGSRALRAGVARGVTGGPVRDRPVSRGAKLASTAAYQPGPGRFVRMTILLARRPRSSERLVLLALGHADFRSRGHPAVKQSSPRPVDATTRPDSSLVRRRKRDWCSGEHDRQAA